MTWQDPTVDPYDPDMQDFTPETKPLDQVISEAIEGAFLRKHVWMPAKIVAINGNQKVDIQILLQGRYLDGQVITHPPIQNCIVSMPMGADYSMKLPIAVGDTGVALFCDRSLDIWSVQGGIVDPQDARTHDFSDAIFVPGLYPFTQQTQDATDDLVLTNGECISRFKKDGGVEFTDGVMTVKFNADGTFIFTNSTNELMDLLTQITDQTRFLSETLSTDTVNTIFGPQKLNAFLTYTQIAQTLQLLLDKLNTLKGA